MYKRLIQFSQILVYSTLFLPLVVNQSFVFPFITPRNYLFRLVMTIAAVVLAVLWINYPHTRPRKSWISISVVAVFLAKLLSGLFGVNWFASFWSNYERMEGIVGWLFLVIFYFVIITVFTKREEWMRLWKISLVPAVIVALYGLGQAWGLELSLVSRQSRIESLFGNAAYVGAYMMIYIGVAVYVLLKEKHIAWRAVSVFGLIVFHLALFYSATRGAIVGWGIGIMVASILYIIFGQHKKLRIIFGTIGIVVVLLSSGIWLARDSSFVTNTEVLRRMTTISLTEGTVKSRFEIWNIAYQGWKEKPIFGWGQENFHQVYNKYYSSDLIERWVDRAHNNLLDQLSMGGVVTFLAYIFMLLMPFYIFWRIRKEHVVSAVVLVGLWTGYIIQNQFVFDSINTYIFLFGFLAFMYFYEQQNTSDQDANEKSIYQPKFSIETNYLIGFVAVLVGLFAFYNVVVPGYSANRLFIQSVAAKAGDPEAALDLYEQSLAKDSYGTREIALNFGGSIDQYLQSSALDDQFKEEVLLSAIDGANQGIAQDGNDVRLLIQAGRLYDRARVLGDEYVEQAEQIFEHALELSPGRVEVYQQLAQLAYYQEDQARAEEYLLTAYELDHSQLSSTNILLMLYLKEDYEAGLAWAEQHVAQYQAPYAENEMALLVEMYKANQLWDKAALWLERLTDQFSNNVTYWQELAQVYREQGDLEKAALVEKALHSLQTEAQ